MSTDWSRHNIPPAYADKMYQLHSDQHQRMFKDATDFIKNSVPHTSLYIFGKPEIGKTIMATTLLKLFVNWFPYGSAEFVSPDDYMSKYDSLTGTEKNNFIISMVNRDLIVLDDLGSSRNHDWPKEKLSEFFDQRFKQKKKTIFTSNWTDLDLKKEYGDRIYRRICGEENAIVIDLNNLPYNRLTS